MVKGRFDVELCLVVCCMLVRFDCELLNMYCCALIAVCSLSVAVCLL